MKLYAVLIKRANKSEYFKADDSDGNKIVPLYINYIDAARAAERSDLDFWEIVSVYLPARYTDPSTYR